jgi:hypothetical protein
MLNRLWSAKPALWLWGMFGLGMLARLAGVPFSTQGDDIDQMVLAWGGAVREFGLGQVHIHNYGPFSYAIFSAAFAWAEAWPRFWWAPYKLINIGLEIGILLALWRLLPKHRWALALGLFWLNPLFIYHGSWLGLWDSAYTLCALLAVLVLRRFQSGRLAWILAGGLLMASAMVKPQGFVYFMLPIGILLLVQFVRRGSLAWVWCSLGMALTALATTGVFMMLGGSLVTMPLYLADIKVMPNLCNECVNVWRPVVRILQMWLGQSGLTYMLVLPLVPHTLLHALVLAGVVMLMGVFALQVTLADAGLQRQAPVKQLTLALRLAGSAGILFAGMMGVRLGMGGESPWVLTLPANDAGVGMFSTASLSGRFPPIYLDTLGAILGAGVLALLAAPLLARWAVRVATLIGSRLNVRRETGRGALAPETGVFLILAIGSLAVSQLGTRAHINHSYAAFVLLIPLVASHWRRFGAWLVLTLSLFYAELAGYGLGRDGVLPTYQPLPELARALTARMTPDAWPGILQFQVQANQFIRTFLPQEPVVTILSGVMFLCVVWLLRELFLETRAPLAVA